MADKTPSRCRCARGLAGAAATGLGVAQPSKGSVVNQTQMLHQMCREVLTEGDLKAVARNRGLPNQAAASRPILESLFLTETGVAAVLQTLEPTEIALLHLLKGRDKPVDVAFFSPLEPAKGRDWQYGTFTQRFQGVFNLVRDRLVRRGILLLALGPETAAKAAKMERWQYALPVQFVRFLPPLLGSARPLAGAGDWRADAGREKLQTVLRPAADPGPKNDRLTLNDGELCWGGEPFQAARLDEWRLRQWQAATAPAPARRRQEVEAYTLPPAGAVLTLLAGLEAGHWCDAQALATPLAIYCGAAVDAAAVCEAGWRWGFLARQEAEGRAWYRPAPAAPADLPPERYLAVRGDAVAVDLDAVPFAALETLARMAALKPLPAAGAQLLAAPDLIKLGQAAATAAALPLAAWLREHAPAFRQAFATVRQRHGKTILHENLAVARVTDLSLQVALKKALGDRLVALGDEFVAFPTGATAEVKRLVAQLNHVVKEVAP